MFFAFYNKRVNLRSENNEYQTLANGGSGVAFEDKNQLRGD